jgi:hypothetical protein
MTLGEKILDLILEKGDKELGLFLPSVAYLIFAVVEGSSSYAENSLYYTFFTTIHYLHRGRIVDSIENSVDELKEEDIDKEKAAEIIREAVEKKTFSGKLLLGANFVLFPIIVFYYFNSISVGSDILMNGIPLNSDNLKFAAAIMLIISAQIIWAIWRIFPYFTDWGATMTREYVIHVKNHYADDK